jgi:betaine-homocysteine S-methyltransferase
MSRQALQVAVDVAVEHDSLVAGNICNTNVFEPNDTDTHGTVRERFVEQVAWTAAADAELDAADTLSNVDDALLAFDVIKLVTVYRSSTGADCR